MTHEDLRHAILEDLADAASEAAKAGRTRRSTRLRLLLGGAEEALCGPVPSTTAALTVAAALARVVRLLADGGEP
jgi:hypothetical protein